MSDQRRQYRIPSPNVLSVELVVAGKDLYSGNIADISAQGISLDFSYCKDPECGIKEAVHLKITSDQLEKPIFVPSVVRRCREVVGGRIYGFEFIDWLGLLSQLPQVLAELFNRRSDYRVEPDPDKPIGIILEALPLRVESVLRNISTRGLSVYLASNMETVFRKVRKVQVSFRLPSSLRTLTFQGRILHKRLTEKGVCYGIIFDPKQSEDFKKNQTLLAEYIQKRRKTILGLPMKDLKIPEINESELKVPAGNAMTGD